MNMGKQDILQRAGGATPAMMRSLCKVSTLKASTNSGTLRRTTTRRVEDRDNPSTDASSDSEQEVVQRVAVVEQVRDRAWPGVQGITVQTQFIQHMEKICQVQ